MCIEDCLLVYYICNGVLSKRKMYRLTCYNILRLAWEYRKNHNVESDDLVEITCMMLNDYRMYCLGGTLARNGAPDYYIQMFKESCESGKFTCKATTIRQNIFRVLRRYPIVKRV